MHSQLYLPEREFHHVINSTWQQIIEVAYLFGLCSIEDYKVEAQVAGIILLSCSLDNSWTITKSSKVFISSQVERGNMNLVSKVLKHVWNSFWQGSDLLHMTSQKPNTHHGSLCRQRGIFFTYIRQCNTVVKKNLYCNVVRKQQFYLTAIQIYWMSILHQAFC